MVISIHKSYISPDLTKTHTITAREYGELWWNQSIVMWDALDPCGDLGEKNAEQMEGHSAPSPLRSHEASLANEHRCMSASGAIFFGKAD